MTKLLFALILFLGCLDNLFAYNRLNYNYKFYSLNSYESDFSEDQVNQIDDTMWKEINFDKFKFSNGMKSHWYRLDLDMQGSEDRNIVLHSKTTLLKKAEFYYFYNGKMILSKTLGTALLHAKSNSRSLRQIFPFSLKVGKSTVFIRLSPGSNSFGRFELLTPDQYAQYRNLFLTSISLYFGCGMALFFINIFLFIFLRQKFYFYYLAFLSFAIFSAIVRSGLWDYLFANVLNISSDGIKFKCVIASNIFAIAFAISFLEIKNLASRLYYLLRFIVIVGVILMISFGFSSDEIFKELSSRYYMMVVIFSLLLSAIIMTKRNTSGGLFYLISWSIFLATVAIWTVKEAGYLPSNNFTMLAPLFGQMFEMIGLSLGMSARMGSILKENIEVKQKSKDRQRLDDLLRVICHDLANPLTVAKNYNDAVLESFKTKNSLEQDLLKKCKTAMNVMETIIDEARQYQAVNSEKIDLPFEKVLLGAALGDVIFVFEKKLRDKQIKLNIKDNSSDFDFIDTNLNCLKNTIISNILSNAIKFSHAGSKIDITIMPEEETVDLIIKDYGVGIPKDILEVLLDPSKVTSRKGTGGESGTGFGMPLVYSYMQRLDATMEISSIELHRSSSSDPIKALSGTTVKLSFPRFKEIDDSTFKIVSNIIKK